MHKDNENNNRIDNIRAMLASVSLGNEIVNWLDEQNIDIRFNKFIGNGNSAGSVGYPYSTILLNPKYSDEQLVSVLAHESRHLWQARKIAEMRGLDRPTVWEDNLNNPFSMMIIQRYIEADAWSLHNTVVDQLVDKYPEDTDIGKAARARQSERLYYADNVEAHENKRLAYFAAFLTSMECIDYDLRLCPEFGKQAKFMLTSTFNALTGRAPAIKDEILSQDVLEAVADNAWGEYEGKNYLRDSGENGLLFDYARSSFMRVSKNWLRRANITPGYRHMNIFIDQSGQKRPLVKF